MTTPAKLRIFVSSVQKELEHERAAVAQLISVDPFLLKHCEPVLYEKDPSTGRPNAKGYLDRLRDSETLALLHQMEQRGTGFARMRDAMLDQGLDAPVFAEEDGFSVVTFPGPNGNYDRLMVPAGASGLVTPAVEAQLNERQKKMVVMLAAGEELTSRRCEAEFQVTRPVTAKDLGLLVKLGLAQKVASGRSTPYRLKPQSLSNR